MNNELIAARLEAVAAIAKVLAYDVRESKLWDGERDQRLSMIHEMLRGIPSERNHA